MSMLLRGVGKNASAAGGPFVSDTMTGANGVFDSHVGETGATWTNIYESTAFIDGNACRIEGGTFKASGTPGSADYYIEIAITRSVSLSGGKGVGIIGRWAGAGDDGGNFYQARVASNAGEENLVYLEAVGPDYGNVSLGTYDSTTTVPSTLRLTFSGTSIKVHVDGVERISVTDATFSAAGSVGITGGANYTNDALYINTITAQ